MEFRVLRYFLAVAREENVSRAAEFLNVTQPTLSRQLMDLEDELGAKLFIRGSRKITLTDEGRLLRKRAEEITELIDKTKGEFLTKGEIVSGDVYIGSGETDGVRIIAKAANELQKNYPNIHFHISSGNAEDVTERLDKGLLDFGLLIGVIDMAKYDFICLPASDTWGVLMRKDSPLAVYETIKPEDLWNVPLIISRQPLASGEISRWMKKDYKKLNIIATYNLVYNVSIMVEEGMGYALTLDKLVNTGENSSLCFKPLNPEMKASIYIVWKKYQVFSKASDIFLKKIQHRIEGDSLKLS